MTRKGYIATILLGIIGLSSSLMTLVAISNDASTVDSKIYVLDSINHTFDSIQITQNKLGLVKKTVTPQKELEIKNTNRLISYNELTYNLYPNYMLWIIIISLGISLAFSLIPFLNHLIQLTGNDLTMLRFYSTIGLAILSSVLIFYMGQRSAVGRIFAITNLIEYTAILFKHPHWVLNGATGLILLPNFFCLGGNFMIVDKLLDDTRKIDFKSLIYYHKLFSQFLVISAVLLVFGVLSSSLLRMSVLDVLPSDMSYLFPAQFVISYSLIFTFFLLIFYLPGEFLFRHKLSIIKEGATENELIRIKEIESKTNVFKLGISMLAPILSGILLESLKTL